MFVIQTHSPESKHIKLQMYELTKNVIHTVVYTQQALCAHKGLKQRTNLKMVLKRKQVYDKVLMKENKQAVLFLEV